MTQEQNTTCDCTHTQACEVCAASKDIDWNIIEPKEQNTATSAEQFLREVTLPHGRIMSAPEGFPLVTQHNAREYAETCHASKLKELSEKGEPTDEELIAKYSELHALCIKNKMEQAAGKMVVGMYGRPTQMDYRQMVIDVGRWALSKTSPVIAALRAENEQIHKEIASLRAQLEVTKTLATSITIQLIGEPYKENVTRALECAKEIVACMKGGKAHE